MVRVRTHLYSGRRYNIGARVIISPMTIARQQSGRTPPEDYDIDAGTGNKAILTRRASPNQ
jgi:hypothetical protein